MTYKEFVIWGIPPHQTEETLLVTKPNGEYITDRTYAEKLLKVLETEHGCTKCHIQELDGTMPDFTKTLQ